MTDHPADEHAEADHEGFSRRGFLAGAAGLTGVALSGVWRGSPARADSPGSSAPDVTAGSGFRFLELDGRVVGSVKSVDGGTPVAEVIEEPPGGDGITHKHLGNVKYEEISMLVGFSMSAPFFDWIKATFDRKPLAKNGAIIATDADRNVKSRFEFVNALITEIGIPACDGASKDPAYLSLKVAPETTSNKLGAGTVATRPSNQAFLPSNFRVSIGALPCNKVNKVEAFTVKQGVIDSPKGPGSIEPAKLEFPNLTLTLPEAHAWSLYFDDFVVKGNNGQDKELSGKLELLSTDLSHVLARVSFAHLGIFGLAPDRPEPNSLSIRRVKAEMYCEDMAFEYRPPVA